MNIINISKTVLIAFFAIHSINSQLFAAGNLSQNQKSFIQKVKIYATAMVIGATSTLAASPIAIDLDEDTKVDLINYAKQENVNKGYWPQDVCVQLEKIVPVEKYNNKNFCISFRGFYDGFIYMKEESDEKTVFLPVTFGKSAWHCFSEQELDTKKFNEIKKAKK